MAVVTKLHEEEIRRLDLSGFVSCSPDALVGEVLKKMRETRVSAVLIESAGELAGIFTERDALIIKVRKKDDEKSTEAARAAFFMRALEKAHSFKNCYECRKVKP